MTTRSPVPTVRFNNGVSIPQLGFGVFRVDPGETERIVTDALEVGYRHLDTAAIYGNEDGVGRAIAASGIPRDELFVTTKLWNDRHQDAEAAFNESLERLGLDYIDLYLIHWPVAPKDTFVDAWNALRAISASGQAKSVGVSNFTIANLERLLQETGTVPAIDQVELHVDFQQRELREYLAKHEIVTEAWFPLGGGKFNDSPELTAIAGNHGKTLAQTILRWHMQLGTVAIPKSNRRARMQENFDIFDFELTDGEMATIARLDRGAEGRNGTDPDEFV